MSNTLLSEPAIGSPQGEQATVYTERDLWYFRTGEGTEIGPFRYRSEAETGLQRFLSKLQERLQP